MSTGGGENQPALSPVKCEEGFDELKKECEMDYEVSKHVVCDSSQHKPWKQFLKGFSALKSETNEHKGAKHDAATVQSKRLSSNSAGSEVVW